MIGVMECSLLGPDICTKLTKPLPAIGLLTRLCRLGAKVIVRGFCRARMAGKITTINQGTCPKRHHDDVAAQLRIVENAKSASSSESSASDQLFKSQKNPLSETRMELNEQFF